MSIATSRPFYSMQKILDKLRLNSFMIFIDGAQIVDARTGITVWKRSINPDSVADILRIGRKYDLRIGFSDFRQDLYAKKLKDVAAVEVADIYFENVPLGKIVNIERELSAVRNITTHRIILKRKDVVGLDITDVLATKQHAVVHAARFMNVNPKNIIGVGDGPNDYSLLMACGLKVAMGNAVAQIKAVADVVAPSVGEDGAAWVIDKFRVYCS